MWRGMPDWQFCVERYVGLAVLCGEVCRTGSSVWRGMPDWQFCVERYAGLAALCGEVCRTAVRHTSPLPGVDSTTNRNVYQVYFLGVKAAGA